jgi:hypothetical protein
LSAGLLRSINLQGVGEEQVFVTVLERHFVAFKVDVPAMVFIMLEIGCLGKPNEACSLSMMMSCRLSFISVFYPFVSKELLRLSTFLEVAVLMRTGLATNILESNR